MVDSDRSYGITVGGTSFRIVPTQDEATYDLLVDETETGTKGTAAKMAHAASEIASLRSLGTENDRDRMKTLRFWEQEIVLLDPDES